MYERVIQNDRVLSNALAQTLHVTKSELAAAIGLSADSSRERERERSGPTQRRMRDVVEILNRVSHWTGSDMQAYAWYRSEPLPAFGQRTASDLVAEGLADAVKTHLSRIAVGGFA
ncbi:XRE family transcriptional regulator [Salinisphaera japonica YTM-1]|uniref:XRE family transcriptional regulator n=1 Tax=Salinisphaera japonica YTM-1 TaxID=1209778 RepID=A0A423PEY6_9GAMM|nr:XRE family transcriptional regulator [Salinisphaera japonica YTM-1]